MTGLDFLPVVLIAVPLAGTGLIVWGRTHARVDIVEKSLDKKAEKDVVDLAVANVDKRLDRIETKLDRALEIH